MREKELQQIRVTKDEDMENLRRHILEEFEARKEEEMVRVR